MEQLANVCVCERIKFVRDDGKYMRVYGHLCSSVQGDSLSETRTHCLSSSHFLPKLSKSISHIYQLPPSCQKHAWNNDKQGHHYTELHTHS